MLGVFLTFKPLLEIIGFGVQVSRVYIFWSLISNSFQDLDQPSKLIE